MNLLPDADVTFDAFVTMLSKCATDIGWSIVRYSTGHSDRDFEACGDGRRTAFTAKISQTDNGFWGLTEAKAGELAQTGDQLILLTDAESGYFISPAAYVRLLPKFSRTREGSVRINEGIVRKEIRFTDPQEAFELLRSHSTPLRG